MIVLADNDILLKLARCNLFSEFQVAFSITPADIRILKTTRFSVTSNRHRKRIGAGGYGILTAFLGTVTDIHLSPDPDIVAALTEQTDKNIDAGEAVLFAVCPLIPDAIVATGDKKSLTGFALASLEDPVCAGLYQELFEKVICFEQILQRIVDHFGFESVRQKLIDGRECDGGLALWLGSGLNASENAFREGLSSFLADVRNSSGSLLASM